MAGQWESVDDWLDVDDAPTRRRRDKVRLWIGQPIEWAKKFTEFSHTSPGLMTIITTILSVVVLIAGVSTYQTTVTRQNHYEELSSSTEPASYAAHNLYTSLSLANTFAVSGFARFGDSAHTQQEKYEEALRRATLAATETAANASEHEESSADPDELIDMAHTNQYLPVYTGLVESARANRRSGNPVGSAYMAEASALMRQRILPSASAVFRSTSQRVEADLAAVTAPVWGPLTVLLVALMLLIAAQRWLANHTRRKLNAGFLLSTVLLSIALLWLGAANALAWRSGDVGSQLAARPYAALTDARIMGQQARTVETLALVRRGSFEESDDAFNAAYNQLTDALNTYDNSRHPESTRNDVATAKAALLYWHATHTEFTTALASGQYQRSVDLALSPTNSTAEAFQSLDKALTQLIDSSRSDTRSYIDRGRDATRGVGIGVLILSIISVLSLWLGIRPRLQEYL